MTATILALVLMSAPSGTLSDVGAGFQPALGRPERAPLRRDAPSQVASVDERTLDAYVAGLFGIKRIVLWHTIIARMTPAELLFVMGHGDKFRK